MLTEQQLIDDFRCRDVHYFDAACALYWYCSDWHSGQWSTLYSIMSARLHYTPGACESGPAPDTTDADLYAELARGEIDPEMLLAWIQWEYEKERED